MTGARHSAFESCATLMSESLDAAVERLTRESGRDVAGLRWGEAHLAVAEHRPFSSVAPLARLFELRTPYPGDTFTINVGALSNRDRGAVPHAARGKPACDLRPRGARRVDLGAVDRTGRVIRCPIFTHRCCRCGATWSLCRCGRHYVGRANSN